MVKLTTILLAVLFILNFSLMVAVGCLFIQQREDGRTLRKLEKTVAESSETIQKQENMIKKQNNIVAYSFTITRLLASKYMPQKTKNIDEKLTDNIKKMEEFYKQPDKGEKCLKK